MTVRKVYIFTPEPIEQGPHRFSFAYMKFSMFQGSAPMMLPVRDVTVCAALEALQRRFQSGENRTPNRVQNVIYNHDILRKDRGFARFSNEVTEKFQHR